MKLGHFDPSIVTVKQSSVVSQIVSCPVVLSYMLLAMKSCNVIGVF